MSDTEDTGRNRTLHRANYMLERGVWWATCRECGHQVADVHRRQAATQFRQHIQAMRDRLEILTSNMTADIRDHVINGIDLRDMPGAASARPNAAGHHPA